MLPLHEEQIEHGNEIDSWSIAAEYYQCHGEDDNTKSKCHEQKRSLSMAQYEDRVILAIECGHCRQLTGLQIYNDALYIVCCGACG